jgi:hypothetical protein
MSWESVFPVLIMLAFAVLFIWILPRLKGGT